MPIQETDQWGEERLIPAGTKIELGNGHDGLLGLTRQVLASRPHGATLFVIARSDEGLLGLFTSGRRFARPLITRTQLDPGVTVLTNDHCYLVTADPL